MKGTKDADLCLCKTVAPEPLIRVGANKVAPDSYAQLNKNRITLSGVVKLKREIVIDSLELKEIASTASNHPLQKTRL